MQTFSFGTFLKKYRSEDACLERIKEIVYPDGITCKNCKKVTNFTKIKDRPVYQCSCGYQVSPLAGTIFEKTTTPLSYWLYAMFIMTATRSGVSAKALQRELGVTYKTAWRMMKQIRILMASTDTSRLSGTVEADESYFGGDGKFKHKWSGGVEEKQAVLGIIERQGKAYLKHVPDTSKYTLITQIKEHVDPTARVMTDQYVSYTGLYKFGYFHQTVNHQKHQYAIGDVHTQNIENLWSNIKRGITGVYRIVSKKYLQSYLDEYGWRFNNRHQPGMMFDLLLSQVGEVKAINGVDNARNIL